MSPPTLREKERGGKKETTSVYLLSILRERDWGTTPQSFSFEKQIGEGKKTEVKRDI
jgi:hypothetical protein